MNENQNPDPYAKHDGAHYTPGIPPAQAYAHDAHRQRYDTPAPVPAWSNTPPPVHTPKKRKAWLIPAGALALGLIIGGASTAGAKPEPVTITETVENRVEVPVSVTPAACLEALTYNEQAFDHLSTSLGHIAAMDYAAAETSTAKVKALAPKSNAAKAACRAAAK